MKRRTSGQFEIVPPDPPTRIVCLTESPAVATLVRETIGVALPWVRFESTGASGARPVPAADGLIADARLGEVPGVELLRDLRASGFAGGAVLLHDGAPDAELLERAARVGATLVERGAIARALAPAIAGVLPEQDDRLASARAELRRTEQLVAAGEIALQLQHALNNPLTALLAEAQLLEMEPLPEEQQTAVRRIVELCRRTIGVARRLDRVGGAPPPPPREPR
jgi:signal transduction histidine kinase